MSGGWDGQYDAFQGQGGGSGLGGGFYNPTSPYNFGDTATVGGIQSMGNTYPNIMTPSDPYAEVNQQGG